MKRVIIAGMGPGSKSCITEEVKAAIDNAEIIIAVSYTHLTLPTT